MYLIDSLPKRYLALSSSFVKPSIVKNPTCRNCPCFLSFRPSTATQPYSKSAILLSFLFSLSAGINPPSEEG